MTAPPGFDVVREGSTTFLLRADLGNWLLPLLRVLDSDRAAYETRMLAAGRGGTRLVHAAGNDVVVRPYRRGGLPAWVLHDTYFGWRPRPFRELAILAGLRQRGAPVVDVYGARVDWLVPGCYRGWLVTRYVADSHTLWEWITAAPSPALRGRVLEQVGRAVRCLHDTGAAHPDLNLNNILIGPNPDAAEPPAVVFIDFDCANTATAPSQTADLARLERSARKLDPDGKWLTAADLDTVRVAYAAGAACA